MRRLILVVLLIVALMGAVEPIEAKGIQCDADLFLAAQITSFYDPTPPPLDFQQMHWQYVDGHYQTDYWQQSGFGGIVRRVQVKHQGKVMGVATNGVWSQCNPKQAWKRYLVEHLP